MITTLHIKNIGIIDDLELNLNNDLNVLTGETGAGKTLIIDSLNIIAGGRFSKEMIRKGEEYSYVELCLYLPNNEMSIDENIIVSREIYSNGRNLCKINGRMVTVSELKFFMNNIVDIHGQHDNQSLLDKEVHIKYLDDFAGEKIQILKKEYTEIYEEYLKLKQELKKNYGDDKEKQRKLDLLKYQYNEINEMKLEIGEDDKLEKERKTILNQEKIVSNLNEADSQIDEIVLESISNAIRNFENIEELNEDFKEILNDLKSSYYDIQEISRDISKVKVDTYFDEEQRKEMEERLDFIYSLKRKYGNTIGEILLYKDQIEEEINTIENLEEYINELKENKENLEKNMYDVCKKMNEIRKSKSIELSKKINLELKDLEMKNAMFSVNIVFNKEKEFSKNGLDNIEFLICTNVGEKSKSLSKIASGGEMSRIMLSIKTVLADIDEVPILIFDEIDTGISGIAANRVGEKLKKLSKNHQVLIVTHLASIAAKGKYNYYIYKETEKMETKTKVKLLLEEEVLEEIARISTGNITELAIEHAKELRNCS